MKIKFKKIGIPQDNGKFLYLHKNGKWYVVDLIWQNGDLGYERKVNGKDILFIDIKRMKDQVIQWYWMKGAR